MKNFGEKEAWAYPVTSHFLGTPYYQERVKLRISNCAGIFRGYIWT